MQPRLTGYPIDQRFSGRPKPTQDARIQALARVALFRDLSRRNLARINRVSKVVYAHAGDVLMEQGGKGTEMIVVLEGRASVQRGTRTIAECGAGDCLGEMSLLDNEPRSATVTALEPMRLLTISSGDFKKLLPSAPRLAEALLATMSRRLRDAHEIAELT
jgi:CRP/FNR family transcriptional regulator, cyclic AMP receptor protein